MVSVWGVAESHLHPCCTNGVPGSCSVLSSCDESASLAAARSRKTTVPTSASDTPAACSCSEGWWQRCCYHIARIWKTHKAYQGLDDQGLVQVAVCKDLYMCWYYHSPNSTAHDHPETHLLMVRDRTKVGNINKSIGKRELYRTPKQVMHH